MCGGYPKGGGYPDAPSLRMQVRTETVSRGQGFLLHCLLLYFIKMLKDVFSIQQAFSAYSLK